MTKQCKYCGRYFRPDRRVGGRQKACQREDCKKKRRRQAQKNWLARNHGYFNNHYNDYVKQWRQRRKKLVAQVIKDKIPPSKPLQELILLIPANVKDVIKDEIRLKRVDGYTFTAYG